MNNGSLLRLGPVILQETPQIAVVIDEPLSILKIKDLIDEGASILEVRFDLLGLSLEESTRFIAELQKIRNAGILGTIRENDDNYQSRMLWFETLIPYVDAIDIEVEWEKKDKAVKLARESHKKVVLSLHDFEKTPTNEQLGLILAEANEIGADFIKIAVMAQTQEDVARLMMFGHKHKDKNLIIISMGDIGAISRIMAPIFGSLYSYASIKEELAPGILTLKEMSTYLKRFYPDFTEKR